MNASARAAAERQSDRRAIESALPDDAADYARYRIRDPRTAQPAFYFSHPARSV